jgi:hypothetical protein
MNYRACCSVLLLLSCVAWSDSDPNEKIQVKQELRPGTQYVTIHMEFHQTVKMNSEPTTIPYSIQQRTLFKKETSQPDADGFTTVTMSPVHVQVRRGWPDRTERELIYDFKTTPANSPLHTAFLPFLKSRYILTFDSKDAFCAMIIKGNPWSKMTRACPESMKWLGLFNAKIFGIPTISELFTLPNIYLPSHPVKQGDTWSMSRYGASLLPEISYGTPFQAKVTTSEITKDEVVFTFTGILGGGTAAQVTGRQRSKMVFDRNTNRVTDIYLKVRYGTVETHRTKTYRKVTRHCLLVRRTISDKPPTLPPLKPIVVPDEKPATKAPTKTPTTQPATGKKTTPAQAKNVTTKS